MSTHLIDHFMPTHSLREVDRAAVATDPERTYAAVRDVDLYRIGFVRRLFELRTFPERIAARARRKQYAPARSSRIDDIAGSGSGFLILGEEPGSEVVVGAAGKFWQPVIELATVSPGEFVAFDRPGFGKLAWCLRVDPREGGGSWITVDLRVSTPDAASLAKFQRYWLIVGRFSHLIRRSILRLFVQELGRPPSDASRTLPGDELLPSAGAARTDAVTIEAPRESVWPWLAQMGCRRAGWYSFDRLDNGGVKSANRIIPELQKIELGDLLPATPTDPGGFAVLRVEPPTVLVLGSPSLLPGAESGRRVGMFGARYVMTWAFVLEPIGDDATRLLVRVRGDFEDDLRAKLTRTALLPLHAIMEHEQLANLKQRAESLAGG